MLPGPARDGSLGHDAAHKVDKDKAGPLFHDMSQKRRCGFEDDGEKMEKDGVGRIGLFDVKGGFCRLERGTKLKMRRGREGRERELCFY